MNIRYALLLAALPLMASGANLKGKSMNGERFAAELTLQGGSPVKGKVKFRTGKKLTFIAHNGVSLDLRIRPICADTAQENMDSCWPNLKIDADDGSARTGALKIDAK